MDCIEFDEVTAPKLDDSQKTPLKDWRLKYEAGTIQKNDFIDFYRKEARQYFYVEHKPGTTVKCHYKEAEAKEGIIDVMLEFILNDNPKIVLEKLRKEGKNAAVCGKVFKTGEPTYSCRECGMDPTCVLCVNCFKQSPHRFHKYKMSTSGGGGCCDCGDEEAWKKDHYCEEHLRGKENPGESVLITDAIKERCEIVFAAVLTFCVNFLEIEMNASLECLDSGGRDDDDEFCTVLYNDESHTFDQVIQVLTKIAMCPQKDAMEMVAAIDREGRSVVKCDMFTACTLLKDAIEKQSMTLTATLQARSAHALRVSVLHMRAVSCQQLALHLLTWFQEFLMLNCTFRRIFVKLLMDPKAPYSIRHILEYDVKLWKTARVCWHRLLISGMLMEYDNKMTLAVEFSRHYATVMQDFIRDDHEHSFSIASLSVQLFTVPSIAHQLIAQEGIFHKLTHTFYHESIEKFIQNKTVHFAKNTTSQTFKRAAHILYDIRYILSFRPDVWTDELREGFLEGCKALLRLLNVMQGMESMTRQTGQHMDYEPEWECAFNLHIKLANALLLLFKWCPTDNHVLVKLYQMVMRYLYNNGFIVGEAISEERTAFDHVANCIIHDVSSKPVSLHLPLSRFFAGLYLHLGSHGLNYYNACQGPKRTPEEIMEPILCTLTMVAQVNAGMWRRNGYSLLHQLYFYRNVRCRSEMLDRDIIGMQIGASLIDSNQFLIHVMNKFNLLDWARPDYEKELGPETTEDDFIRTLSMIDEFFELLINVVCERFVPGVADVSEEDCTKKEIIQLLCIKPFSHSELSRSLPESSDTALEDVIETVATFKKPQKSDAKGVYELKPELFESYNLYFYHYTKEDKSKSEETQRLRRKQKGELVCCPPPKLPKLTRSFTSIVNLLQCDVMLKIIMTVLQRGVDLKAKSFQENHLQKVLHLIGTALQEEQSGNYAQLSFIERANEHKMLAALEELSRSTRGEANRDFILWTMQKYKEVQRLVNPATADPAAMQSNDAESLSANATDTVLLTTAEQEKREKEARARMAAERRAKIMAQMQNAQKNFMISNAEMFASEAGRPVSVSESTASMDWQEDDESVSSLAGQAAHIKTNNCLGYERRLQQPAEQNFKCILCFEDCTVCKDGPTIVYSAYVQKSKILPPESQHQSSVHTSSCGHVMHYECWRTYYNNEEAKELRRPNRSRSGNAGQVTEFQCPYCRFLSNSVLPLTAPLFKYAPPYVASVGDGEILNFESWIEVLKRLGDKIKHTAQTDSQLHIPRIEELVGNQQDIPLFERVMNTVARPERVESWETMFKFYMKTVRQYAPQTVELKEEQGLLWAWHSCIYTIQALEVYLRAIDKPLKSEMSMRHKSCLSGLVRASCLHASHISSEEMSTLLLPIQDLLDTIFKQQGSSVLDWNCYSLLVSLIIMVPSVLYAKNKEQRVIVSGSMGDYYAVLLMFLANMLKALVYYEAAENDMEVDEDNDETLKSEQLTPALRVSIINFYNNYNLAVRRQRGATVDSSMTNEAASDTRLIAKLFAHIQLEMREYLRCCCLFFHFVTDVDFPETFGSTDTFADMCSYLGLSTALSSYFEPDSFYLIVLEHFAAHPDIANYDFKQDLKRPVDGSSSTGQCTRPVPQMVSLPEDYSDLINSVSDFICPNNEREEMKTPTMCLVCGEILCGQSYCCQPELNNRTVGACTYHNDLCGAEIGVFLRIRDCQIVYLGRNKGCFVQPPYLDEYGETDQGLRRGNPLRLCRERYSKIQLTWLGHGLHEEIARLNDNSSVGMTQWHHM